MAHDWITKHSRVFKKKAVANKRLNKTREAVGDIKDHHAEKKKTRLIYSPFCLNRSLDATWTWLIIGFLTSGDVTDASKFTDGLSIIHYLLAKKLIFCNNAKSNPFSATL